MSKTPLMEHSKALPICPIKNFQLPDNCKMLVNFTLDYDTMVFRTHLNEPPLWRTQGEFGGRVGIWRILSLFKKHNIKSTIFLPGYTGTLYPESLKQAVLDGHEIANHMWKHYIPDSKEVEKEHLDKTDYLIREISGKFPVGTRSQHDLSLLEDRKYIYYSYFPGGDKAFYVYNYDINDWILNIPMDIMYDDAMYFYFGWFGSSNEQQRLASPDIFYDTLIESFDHLYNSTGYMNICLHPNISGRSMQILILEKLITAMKKYDNVVFETTEFFAHHLLSKHPVAQQLNKDGVSCLL